MNVRTLFFTLVVAVTCCHAFPPCMDREKFNEETYQCMSTWSNEFRLPFAQKKFSNDFIYCPKLALEKDEYTILSSNMLAVPILLQQIFFSPDYGILNRTQQAFVCYPREFRDCEKRQLLLGEYQVLRNKTLYTLAHDGEMHKFGHYKLYKNYALICATPEYNTTLQRAQVPESDGFRKFLLAGWIMSLIGLLLTFVLQANFNIEMGSFRKSLLCYVGSMFFAYLSLTLAELAAIPVSSYVFLMILIQFSFLSTFSWLNVLCFDTYVDFRTLIQPESANPQVSSFMPKQHRKFLFYSIYAWSWPTLLCVVTILLDLTLEDSSIKPNFVEGHWFSGSMGQIFLFYGPMGMTILVNLGLFAATVYIVMVLTRRYPSARSTKVRFLAASKIFLVMGVSWIFEIISWASDSPNEHWYFTDTINSLHGVFVFFIFNTLPKCSAPLRRRSLYSDEEEEQQLDQAIDGVSPSSYPRPAQKMTPVTTLAEKLAKPKTYNELQSDAENSEARPDQFSV